MNSDHSEEVNYWNSQVDLIITLPLLSGLNYIFQGHSCNRHCCPTSVFSYCLLAKEMFDLVITLPVKCI